MILPIQELALSVLTWGVCAIIGIPVLVATVYILARVSSVAYFASKTGYVLRLKKLGVNDGR